MSRGVYQVSLGFSREEVSLGTHICLVYTNEEERIDLLLKFLLSGMQSGERAACFSDNVTEEMVQAFFKHYGVSYDECKEKNAIFLARTSDVYFEGGSFNPEKMLKRLSVFYNESLNAGFTASRVIGEMIKEIEVVPNGNRLMEYESRITLQVRDEPMTTVCLYNANEFDGATIMNVLKVHPKMIVNGSVVHNPFYIKPEEYLKGLLI